MDPLFVEDLDTLKKHLRFSGINAAEDIGTILEQAILATRTNFYRRLTQTRIEQLQAMASVTYPADAEEYLHSIAKLTEIRMVRLELTWTAPVLFQDASGEAQEAWDHQPSFRRDSPYSLDKLRNYLKSEIEEAIEILKGEEDIGEEQKGFITVFEPDETPPRIGDSLYPDE